MGRKRKPVDNIIQLNFFELTDHVALKTKPYWIPQYHEDPITGRVTTDFAEIAASRVVRRQPRLLEKPAKYRTDMIIFPTPKGKKWCSQCGDWVSKNRFSPKADAFDGLHPYCRVCRADWERKRYWAAKETAQAA